MLHEYDSDFMSYADQTSRFAAKAVVDLLQAWFSIRSVLDVGCARGTWLSVWRGAGAVDTQGVDGEYIDRNTLVMPREQFAATDLSVRFDFLRCFDLVQSLEVAEHIPAASASVFIDNLVRHARGLILFSAAPPGQGGEFHINEQPYEYWREKLAARGYVVCDCLRPRLADNRRVSFWYRYNMLLYVRQDRLENAPADIRESTIPHETPVRDISPAWFRLRKAVIRRLPIGTREWLARSKARHFSQ